MAKKVAIVQSNYIPWKGYFDLINFVDEFILFDDAQYTRRDWRNRNQVKTPGGLAWLSIPVNTKGRYLEAIKDITVADSGWSRRHWRTISAHYGRSPQFRAYEEQFRDLYLGCAEQRLSAINHRFLVAVCEILGIRTRLAWSMEFKVIEGRNQRLIHLCQQAGASVYVSGPSAKGYIDERLFEAAGLDVIFADYSAYPEYPQLFPPFEHHVSVLDLIFSVGPDAPRFMLSFDNPTAFVAARGRAAAPGRADAAH